MLYLGTTPLAGNIKTKLFTSSGTFVVPADVYCIWIDGCGAGGGGGGGNATPGGGGGGGGPGMAIRQFLLMATPGETITVTIPSGGNGGAAGANGSSGGALVIAASAQTVRCSGGGAGMAGANPNGGAGGTIHAAAAGGPAGGGGAGGNPVQYGFGVNSPGFGYYGYVEQAMCRYSSGGPGGALTYAGGISYRQDPDIVTGAANVGASTGNASGGGGGAGGCGRYGIGGVGGSNGAAGSDADDYGAGGGGGSGNAAGGGGSPGFATIYYISKYTIE